MQTSHYRVGEGQNYYYFNVLEGEMYLDVENENYNRILNGEMTFIIESGFSIGSGNLEEQLFDHLLVANIKIENFGLQENTKL